MTIIQDTFSTYGIPSESEIQLMIFNKSANYPLVLPNYTPNNWFECDVCVITGAGYMYEYEIKRTVTDFYADARKRGLLQLSKGGGYQERYKHGLLKERHRCGPSRFWYVTPKGLLDDVKLPEWAGLLEVHNGKLCYQRTQAPRLHRVKIDEEVRTHMQGVLYQRYWSERKKNQKLRDQLREEQSCQ